MEQNQLQINYIEDQRTFLKLWEKNQRLLGHKTETTARHVKQKLLATLSRHHPKSSRKDQEKADWQFLELVTPSAPNSDHAIVVSTEQGASICTPVQARAVYNLLI